MPPTNDAEDGDGEEEGVQFVRFKGGSPFIGLPGFLCGVRRTPFSLPSPPLPSPFSLLSPLVTLVTPLVTPLVPPPASSLQVPVLLLCRLSPWSSKTQDALPISASLKTSGFWSGRLETHRTRYITCKKLPAACEVFLARNSPSLEARCHLKNRLIRRNIYFFRSYGSTVVLYEVLVRRRNSPLFAFS